jgi:hypothetical protein
VQVFSLDSPINGVWAGTICISRNPAYRAFCQVVSQALPVSPWLLAYYGTLWRDQAGNDQRYLTADQKDGLYTAIVTRGDPLFDMADNGAHAIQTPRACDFSTQGSNIGWFSQGLLTGCQLAGAYQVEVACNGASVCSDGTSPPFGLLGDMWVHSWVKNSTVTITSIMQYVTG